MKHNLNLAIAISLIQGIGVLQAQHHLDWSFPIAVVDNDLYDNKRPAMALLADGSPAVVWGKTSPDAVYFSRWDKENFTPPVKLNADGTGVFVYDWAGPEIATYGDSIFVTFKETPELTGPIILMRSFNAGITWEDPVTVDNNPGYITNFPAISVDADGNPKIVYMVSNTDYSGAHYVTVQSADYGHTFTSSVLASEYSGGEVCDCCTPSIVTQGNYVVTLYRDNLDNLRNIWAGISTDGGNTFDQGMQVDGTDWELFACPSSGPDGFIWDDMLYTTWMSGATGESYVYVTSSSLLTLEDDPDIEVTGAFDGLNGQNYPRIANYGPVACMVWQQTGSDFHSQVMLQFTEDISKGWSEADTLWDQSNYGIKHADLALSESDVHIIWQDNIAGRLFYAFSSYEEEETAINNANIFEQIEVFPQPANEWLVVKGMISNNISAIQMTSLNGQRLSAEFTANEKEINIDVRNLLPGAYTLQIITGSGEIFRRLCLIQ